MGCAHSAVVHAFFDKEVLAFMSGCYESGFANVAVLWCLLRRVLVARRDVVGRGGIARDGMALCGAA
jgi:hypothetical protein